MIQVFYMVKLQQLKAHLQQIKADLKLEYPINIFPSSIDEIREQLNNTACNTFVQNLPQLKQDYINALNQCLQNRQEPPFSWNKSNDPSNGKKDIAMYMELIDYCTILGDTSLLDQWAVYPLCDDYPIRVNLPTDLKNYMTVFKHRRDKAPASLKPYYEYLIQAYDAICNYRIKK